MCAQIRIIFSMFIQGTNDALCFIPEGSKVFWAEYINIHKY